MLALVFQDEAQPAYHLPNFNRKPEDHYIDDLKVLQKELNGYGGLYRGIMFQVDRGKTFAKSFKEFVGNAWRGDGYLSGSGQTQNLIIGRRMEIIFVIGTVLFSVMNIMLIPRVTPPIT